MALLFELFEFGVVLQCGLFEVSCFHVEGGLELVDFSTVEFFHSHQLGFEALILDYDVLVLVEEVVDFELELRDGDLFSAEFVFQLDEFVLELDSHLPLVIQIVFIFVFGLFELLSLIF